jgi:hypothetical protein
MVQLVQHQEPIVAGRIDPHQHPVAVEAGVERPGRREPTLVDEPFDHAVPGQVLDRGVRRGRPPAVVARPARHPAGRADLRREEGARRDRVRVLQDLDPGRVDRRVGRPGRRVVPERAVHHHGVLHVQRPEQPPRQRLRERLGRRRGGPRRRTRAEQHQQAGSTSLENRPWTMRRVSIVNFPKGSLRTIRGEDAAQDGSSGTSSTDSALRRCGPSDAVPTISARSSGMRFRYCHRHHHVVR